MMKLMVKLMIETNGKTNVKLNDENMVNDETNLNNDDLDEYNRMIIMSMIIR